MTPPTDGPAPDGAEPLHRFLDGEPVELDDHNPDHRAARLLADGLTRLPPAEVPFGLAGRLTAAALADVRERRRRRLTRVAVGALAASVAVAALGLTLRPGRVADTSLARGPGNSADQPTNQQTNRPTDVPPSLRGSLLEAGTAVAALTRRTATETAEHTRSLIPLPDLPAARPPADPVSRPFDEARQGVAVGLQPVTRSARRAVDLFLRIGAQDPDPDPKPGT